MSKWNAPTPKMDPNRKFAILPAKNLVARCYSVVDIGTQKEEWKGETKLQRKIVLTFEFPNNLNVFKEERGPEPFALSQTYTFSMGMKSNLRFDIESILGRTFDEKEANAFEITEMIGQPCMINVYHKVKGVAPNEKTFANIKSFSPVPDGLTVPPQINKSMAYHISEGENGTFKILPKWLQEKIRASQEFTVDPDEPPVDDEYAQATAKENEERERQ